jgi:hypothetical protein
MRILHHLNVSDASEIPPPPSPVVVLDLFSSKTFLCCAFHTKSPYCFPMQRSTSEVLQEGEIRVQQKDYSVLR